MNKIKWFHVLEIALSCLCAIFLCQALQLQNSVSAGIIAILSIQSTKKRTLQLAVERALFFGVALALAFLCFTLVGYTILAFSLFVFLFAIVCYWKNGLGSLSICCVLVSHFLLAKTMNPAFILNEGLLLVIGVGFGILFTLFTPDSLHSLRQKQFLIEEAMRGLLTSLSALMQGQKTALETEKKLEAFHGLLEETQQRIADFQDNNLLSSSASYYAQYIHMRKNQYLVLLRIFQSAKDLPAALAQTPLLADFFKKIAASFHESNNAQGLLADLEHIKAHYAQSPLPATRGEFEQRATLYRILVEIEQFLFIKYDFIQNLSQKDVATFEKNTGGLG